MAGAPYCTNNLPPAYLCMQSTDIYVDMIFALLCIASSLCEHVSLEVSFSADGSVVPSRALLVGLKVGVPEKSLALMLDFNSSGVEVDSCLYRESHTYDATGSKSDVILFEEQLFVGSEPRGYFRMGVEQHCEEHQMPEHYYSNCVGPLCGGLIGASRRSALWQIWTSFTLSFEHLHLGSRNPYHKSDPVGDDKEISCLGTSDERLCEYRAKIGGIEVTVDFHTENSYIYVPESIYAMYMDDFSPGTVHGTERALSMDKSTKRLFARAMSGHANATVSPRAAIMRFKERLKASFERATLTSRYMRNVEEYYTSREWPPIVIEPTGESTATIVLDYDVLVHSPTGYGSFTGENGQRFFGESSDLATTVLLKPHRYDDRVSIGNGVLRRYTFHKNVLEGRVIVEQRTQVEHLTPVEVILVMALLTIYVRSLCYSLEILAPLGLCMPLFCKDCNADQTRASHHKRKTLHSVKEAFVFLLAFLAPLFMMRRLSYCIDPRTNVAMYIWAWFSIAVNAAGLCKTTLIAWATQNSYRPAPGMYCWRSFRLQLSRFACSEQLSLLSVLLASFVLRKETLGGLFSSLVSCAMITNATRHAYQAFRVRVFRPHALQMHRSDMPTKEVNDVWFLFVLLVLVCANFVLTVPFLYHYVLIPTFRSSGAASFAVMSSVSFGTFLVEIHGLSYIKSRPIN